MYKLVLIRSAVRRMRVIGEQSSDTWFHRISLSSLRYYRFGTHEQPLFESPKITTLSRKGETDTDTRSSHSCYQLVRHCIPDDDSQQTNKIKVGDKCCRFTLTYNSLRSEGINATDAVS
jgi:hypothetical protein